MTNDPQSRSSTPVRIATRGSDLALWQARYVADHIETDSELVILKTQGDEIQHLTLDKVEGKGFFTKEIEGALLNNQADVAVHSFKDLPTEEIDGLSIAAVPVRAPTRDVLVIAEGRNDPTQRWNLPQGATVGTSSLRRKAHLLAIRPDLELVDVRGNVPTRFNRAALGDLDAVVLAEAGLHRLGLLNPGGDSNVVIKPLPHSEMCPAPAQGALAIQIRTDDARTGAYLKSLHDKTTAQCVHTERLLLARFGGGCHLPLGALCSATSKGLSLQALVASPDGTERFEAQAHGSVAEEVAEQVYLALCHQGADKYL